MARPLRIEYSGACYHGLNRGDRRQNIFHADADRILFLDVLARTCTKTQWQVHAYCLMSNHFHLVLETPGGNLVAGMKWLLGTYAMRFNRKHRYSGHLFGGRYKAQLIDESVPGYLRTAADYVHLNPVRESESGSALEFRCYRRFASPTKFRYKGNKLSEILELTPGTARVLPPLAACCQILKVEENRPLK